MKTNELDNKGILNFRVKLTLASLWTSLMIMYLYADLFSLYKPGHISHMVEGFMGPLQANQANLLLASMLMAVPALMIPFSILLKIKLVSL